MAKATDVLEREHKTIQKAVAFMAQLVEQLEFSRKLMNSIWRRFRSSRTSRKGERRLLEYAQQNTADAD